MICLWGGSGWNTSVPGANIKRKSKTRITEVQQQCSSARGRQPIGDELLLQLCGAAAYSDTGLWLQPVVLVMQAGFPQFSPPHLPIPACLQAWLDVLRAAELLGWQGDGTHAPFLQVIIDTCEEGACFEVRRYLPTPAHSCDSTASSTFKSWCPELPLNLHYPAKPSHVVKSDLTEIVLGGLMLISAIYISERTHVSTQTTHLASVSGSKLLSANLIFFSTLRLLWPLVNAVQQNPAWETSLVRWNAHLVQLRSQKLHGAYMQSFVALPLSFVPHSSSWWRCSAVNVKSFIHSAHHAIGNLSLGLDQLPDPPCPMGGQKKR